MSSSNKKILIGLFLLIFFLLVGNVSASQNMTDNAEVQSVSQLDDANLDYLDSIESNELGDTEKFVDFTSNATTGIDNGKIQFTDISEGDISSRLWEFGDGNTSDEQNPVYEYTQVGSYNVKLTNFYSDGTNSSLIKNNYINIFYTGSIIKNPDFDEPLGPIQTIEDGYYVLIYSISDNWNTTGGHAIASSDEVITAKSGNNFLVFGRVGKTSVRPEDHWQDVTTGTPSIFQNLNFDYINSISFYVMNNGNPKNAPKRPVTFLVNIGEIYSKKYSIISSKTWELITIDTSDKSIFNGIQVFNITREYRTMDNFSGDYDGYFDLFTCTYTDLTHAEFDYSIESVIENEINIQFNNEAYGSITNFFWDFGDGTNSTDINPMHSFKPGTYNVKLTASNVNHTDEYSYTLVLEDFPTIGNIIYKSIQDAIDNAGDGDVIDITKDSSENIIIDKNLTLNFNGNKLIGTGSSPVIQVTGDAQATIKNIAFEDSAVLSTDDESSLTITESNIADTNITLSAGNIALDGNNFNGSFITITNANVVISNNNVTNAGIKVNGGKSKINDNNLSGNDVAITQTAGETYIISNLITNNIVGVNITGGNANINFNALYDNTNVSIAYVGDVDASNNWFAVLMPSFSTTLSDEYVDVYAPEAESQPTWLVLTLNTDETVLNTTQDYIINVDLTTNSNDENTSNLGSLPKLTLPITAKVGESSAVVNIENSMGEFTFTTGTLPSDEISFIIKDEEYALDDVVIVAKIIETTLVFESTENGIVTVTLKDIDGNILSNMDINYTINSGSQITDKTVDGKITITGLKGTVTIVADYAGISEYPYYNSTTASETFHFIYDGNINITLPESAKTTETPTITIELPTDAQGTVNVFVDAKKVNTTEVTGTTTIPLTGLGAGEHVVAVTYSDDDIYLPVEKTGTLIVSKVTPTIIATGSSVGENETATVEVSIEGANGIILVEVDGNKYFAELETGSATVNVVGLKAGNYTANIKYSGDEKYSDLTATADIKVSEVEDKTIAELKAELAEAKENATQLSNNLTEANQKIDDLTTQLNETRTNATELAGNLSNANKKIDDLTTQLNETRTNATELAGNLSDAKQEINNLTSQLAQANASAAKGLVSSVISATDLNLQAGNAGNIQVTLKDANNNLLTNKNVSVIINGVTYKGSTNNNGVASISVKFASAGTYNAVVSFMGDETLKSSIGTSKVIVSKKATTLTAKKATLKVKKAKKIKVTLKSAGKAVAGKTVTIKVNKKTFKAKTNKKGVATIKVKVAKKGKFKAVVKFAGDNTYKAVSKKVKLTVKK